MPELRKISNSEVATWLLCRSKYYYQFDLNLVPIKQGTSLARGIIGHEVLAEYYKVMAEGGNQAQAIIEARRHLSKYMDSVFDMELITELDKILRAYWQHYANEFARYEILEVEKQYDLPLNNEFSCSCEQKC